MTAHLPTFEFFLSDADHPVRPDRPVWHRPVPAGRHAEPSRVTVGDYATAVERFFRSDRCRGLAAAAGQMLEKSVAPDAIERVRVFVEKHGEFYHPARISTETAHGTCQMVLNVATGARGIALIETETAALAHVQQRFAADDLPRVFGTGRVTAAGGLPVSMFLGEWFDGFHEFHITATHPRQQTAVWMPGQPPLVLDDRRTRRLYRHVARLLTRYYDIDTAAQIFPWHHAAGDFVLRIQPQDVAVRLITVRGYAPALPSGGSPADMLQALLVFFLSLTLRTRLDRLDGVGEVAWAEAFSVCETVGGVFDALAGAPVPDGFPGPVNAVFKAYLDRCAASDLRDLAEAIGAAYPPASEEFDVIRRYLPDHVRDVMRAMADIDTEPRRPPHGV